MKKESVFLILVVIVIAASFMALRLTREILDPITKASGPQWYSDRNTSLYQVIGSPYRQCLSNTRYTYDNTMWYSCKKRKLYLKKEEN